MGRTTLLGLMALLILSCGDDGTEAPRDGGAFLDVPVPDAPGLDAPGLDMPGLDRPGLDRPGLDIPGLDRPAPDGRADGEAADRTPPEDVRSSDIVPPEDGLPDLGQQDGPSRDQGAGTDNMPDSQEDGQADRRAADGGMEPGLWCNTQWPLVAEAGLGQPTQRLYARVWVEGVTPSGGLDPLLEVELGLGPATEPPDGPLWAWSRAEHNPHCTDCGNNDEFMGTLVSETAGELLWAARGRYGSGEMVYCDRSDEGRRGSSDGWSPDDAPRLMVVDPEAAFRVVTLNLRCLMDDWDHRLPIIAGELMALRPDLMGFEEACTEPGGRDNLDELLFYLGEGTGQSYHMERTVTHLSWDTYEEGLAVVTPHPLVDSRVVTLPAGAFPRKVILARVALPQGQIVYGNTHLDHLDGGTRGAQAQAVAEAISAFAGPGEAIILTGDFNEGPGGPVEATFLSHGYTDVWAALHPGEGGYTFPSSAPTSRIDYVWFLAGTSGLRPRAINIFLNQPLGGIYGSDHFGLTAQVSR